MGFAQSVFAQEERPEFLKYVAVVDISRIFRESQYIKGIRNVIDESFIDRDRVFNQLVDQANSLREKLNREKISLTPEEVANLRQDIDLLEVQIQREDRNLREDKRLAFNTRQRDLEREVIEVINRIAAERRYYIVMELSSILFAEESIDFTEAVITIMDNEKAESR